MASALVKGLLKAKLLNPEQVLACDLVPAALAALRESCPVATLEDGKDMASRSKVILCCVKPQDALNSLRAISQYLENKLLISIVAGIPISQIEDAAGPTCRVVRVMPNAPATVGQGAAGYARGKLATPADAQLVERIFSSVGIAFEVPEGLINAVTGVSGSGPAYACLAIEALADGGVLMGLPRDTALKLAAQTFLGTAAMILKLGEHPAKLKDTVASPGGTTIAGIEKLEEAGLRSAFIQAVRASTERADALGNK